MKNLDPEHRAVMRQFGLRTTDDVISKTRGIAFSIVKCLGELNIGETITVNCDVVNYSNLRRAVEVYRTRKVDKRWFRFRQFKTEGYYRIVRVAKQAEKYEDYIN